MPKIDLDAIVTDASNRREDYQNQPIEAPTKTSNEHSTASLGLPMRQNRSGVQLGVRVPADVAEQLKKLSTQTDVPVARIVTRMLRNGLAEYELR